MYNITVVTVFNINIFQKFDLFVLFSKTIFTLLTKIVLLSLVRIGSLTNVSYAETEIKREMIQYNYININTKELSDT